MLPFNFYKKRQFQNVHSGTRSRRGEVANRRHTVSISRIGQLAPTPILRPRGRFEIASGGITLTIDWQAILADKEIEASAPCRLDVGGTLDLSTFHLPLRHLGPCTFNMAVDLRTRVRLSPHDKGMLKISSRGFDVLEVESHNAPFNHPLGLMIAVASYFQADGIHVQIDSASPPRSALGGSSVAAVALVWAFFKATLAPEKLETMRGTAALLAHAIEQSVAGVPCGLQDQLAAAFGGINAWYWQTDPAGPQFTRRDLLAKGACKDLSGSFLLAYCGAPHVSKDVNGTWVREFISGQRRRQWYEIVECSRRFIDAIENGQYDLAQEAMRRETQLRVEMTPHVLDDVGLRLVDAARKIGSAARFTGAGGGGCIWALAPSDQRKQLRRIWQEILDDHPRAQLLDSAVDATGVL